MIFNGLRRALLLAAWAVVFPACAGEPAPSLVLTSLSGTSFDLGHQHGHVVLVNFWATWCPPCREEIPALNAFYAKYHGKGLEIIGISADQARDREAVAHMASGITYPVAVMKDVATNGFGAPRGLPVTYVIDRHGVIQAELRPDTNPVTSQSLEAIVGPLIGAK